MPSYHYCSFHLSHTSVTQCSLHLVTGLIIPLALVLASLDVDFHTVLIVASIIGLSISPVFSLLCQMLLGSHPRPSIADLANTNPVVSWLAGEHVVQVFDLIVVLDGHHVCIVFPTPLTSVHPFHGIVRVMVRPAFHSCPLIQNCIRKQRKVFHIIYV